MDKVVVWIDKMSCDQMLSEVITTNDLKFVRTEYSKSNLFILVTNTNSYWFQTT